MSDDLERDSSSALQNYYNDFQESSRLKSGWGQLEFVRTQEVLLQHLPAPPACIADIGGGPGIYADWLASLGYNVQLVDPVAQHVEMATKLSGGRFSAITGDARHLEMPDGVIDAALLLGPLYHLTNRDDRLLALGESQRVLKANGCIFAAGISRFASLLDGLAEKLLADPAFVDIVKRDITEGQHRNPAKKSGWFTDSFFHRPAELEQEVEEAGFEVVDQVALEGPAWVIPELSFWWDNPDRRKLLMGMLKLIEKEPSIMGASAHLMIVARKSEARSPVRLTLSGVTLRNWEKQDEVSLAAHANDRTVSQNLRDRFPYPYSVADAREWIRFASSMKHPSNFVIEVEGRAVGGIGFELQSDTGCRSAEIGYWLGRKFWGRGIMTEALKAITDYAFANFDLSRIYAGVYESNPASARVLEKAGYELEGRLRKAVTKNGQTMDKFIYAVIR